MSEKECNHKPHYTCDKCEQKTIPVAELREWCEFHRVCPRHRSIEEIETGYNNALDDILDELCKETPHD